MSNSRIRRLSADLINKIAAGEVIERPASVVKELVENAIDAEASRIEITIEDGGRKLIRVADDGTGMSSADLALAFEPHATSKISDAEDLFSIHTLGFRGEALPSISSVSRCRAVSRERGSNEAYTVECVAGRLGEVRTCGAPPGTIIEVRALFHNIPARLKFLRTPATEIRHIVESVTRLALPHHALEVALLHNGKQTLRLQRNESPRERLSALFSEELSRSLLSVRADTGAMTLTGMISPPGEGLSSGLQYVFLNGRYIRDRSIQRAITEAYRSRLMRGRFPAAFLFLQLDPGRVDVNVHPTKVEVRFRDSGAVFAQVLTAMEKALKAAGPSAAAMPAAMSSGRKEDIRHAMKDFFSRTAPLSVETPLRPPEAKPCATHPVTARTEPSTKGTAFKNSSPVQEQTIKRPDAASPKRELPTAPLGLPLEATPLPTPRAFCQIHNAYIVEQVPNGFLVIDQHALHERVLYEELRERLYRSVIPRQRLLVPELVELRADEFLRIIELKETLLRLGVEVEAFGEKTVAINAVPHVTRDVNPRELILEIVKEAAEMTPDRPTSREEELMRLIACKAAVRAGDHLKPNQIEALLEQRNRLGPEPTCPHGRPTTLRFDLREIEKQFRRK